MHRISAKRLTAFIVSLVACLALAGSPALFSAQGDGGKASARAKKTGSAAAPKVASTAKAAAAPAAPRAKAGARTKRTAGGQTAVSGTTTDGSGHGWALYSRLAFTSDSTEDEIVFSDPVTGQYQATLFDGIDYTVTVSAVSPGYGTTGTDFTTDGTPLVQDWALTIDAVACSALGYNLQVLGLSEPFDAGVLPDGWTITNASEDGGGPWTISEGADPCGEFGGNQTGGAGPYAILNSNCDSLFATSDSTLTTPPVDFSTFLTAQVRFNSDYIDLDSVADVDISTDGGTTWTNVWEVAGEDSPGPSVQSVDISKLAGGQESVTARFHYTGFWAWWWQVDNVILGQANCVPLTGGLVVGNVIDGNTDTGLNGATVTNLTTSASVRTFATPEDTNQEDGFYIMFSPAGPQSLQATQTGYTADTQPTTVFNNDVVRRDFTLQAGMLSASPSPVSAVIPPNGLSTKTLTLTNSGQADVNFEIVEVNSPVHASFTSGFASPEARKQALARLPKDAKGRPLGLDARNARNLPPAPHSSHQGVRTLAAGDVLLSAPTNLVLGWGVGYSGNTNSTWITNLAAGGGDDLDYEFDAAGVQTGNTIDLHPAVTAFPADGAFNANTGMIWYVDVVASGSSCIFEVDPAAKTLTGNTICPAGLTSERGLAYDLTTDTYYIGSWVDFTVAHFDASGTVLDSAMVGLGISGLAYFPTTGHLMVQVSDLVDFSISVLDVNNNYATVGTFNVSDGAFDDHGGAGMEADCEGNLWMVNQNTEVLYKVASGEVGKCDNDIPWLTVDPTEGTVPANGGTVPVSLTFNSTGLLPGLNQAQIKIKTDTPYVVPPVPVTLTVLFNDVPENSFAWNFIYGAAGAGVMLGGPPNCGPTIFNFCPNGVVSRADMAGYLFRAIHGRNTPPPVYLNTFADVTFNDYNAFYIQGIFNDGITAGCGFGNYCPNSPNTRAQMSVFIWKGQHGDTAPPACTPPGIFADVPCPDGFAVDYIEGLFNEQVTAGCGGNNFCPNDNITNAQMSVFLVKGFSIPYVP